MVCPLSQNYSSPMDYQYYLVVTLKWYENHPGSTTTPPPPPQKKKNKKKQTKKQTSPVPPQKTNRKKKKKQGPREKMKKKEEKREPSLRILPRRTRLLTSLYREKARKAWPTATILNEIFEFSEIYVCQKY